MSERMDCCMGVGVWRGLAARAGGFVCARDYWCAGIIGLAALEREANEFAGRLLVPLEAPKDDFLRISTAFDAAMGRHIWDRDETLRQKTCERIAQRFGGHWQTIATRFDREGLWPSPF